MVTQGMSWPAFFFSVLWALRHRMWWTAAALLRVIAGFDHALARLGADATATAIAGLGLAAYIGLSANDWRGRALERRGMRLATIVAAPNAERAVQRWFERSGPGSP